MTFQASASNAAGATATGATQDYSTALGGLLMGKITNGATGPTIACDFVVEISSDSGTTWREWRRATGSTANNAVREFDVDIPKGVMHIRTKFTGNTAQAVTVEAYASKVTSIG